MATLGKITYTTAEVNLDHFHAAFDEALDTIRSRAGATHPFWIGGRAIHEPRHGLVSRSPIDTSLVLGRFSAASPAHVDEAVRAARAAAPGWMTTPWPQRVAVLRRAAALIRERRFHLAAVLALEIGKSRLEAMGDAEEAADLIDYYCDEMTAARGWIRPMKRLVPHERNVDVLRPYGVFAVIAPFNFPLALSTGMSAAALLGGNTVVYKPAEQALWTGVQLFDVYREAGLPPGVVNLLTGRPEEIGDALWQHELVDGVAFTGSRDVGMRIHRGLSGRWIKPCLMELGGKNATLVMPSADLDAAAEGVCRSAFGLQNQKCSATSRVYVHRDVRGAFVERLVARARALAIGDPTRRDVDFGPVIDERAVDRYLAAAADARSSGTVLVGGERLRGGIFDRGWFVSPAIALLPLENRLFFEELFVPFLAVGEVDALEQAIAETNRADYGLTAGLFSSNQAEIDRFLETVEAGVCYVNRRTGATTGAWPGAQPFCGWKASGSTGKGGCGPYYLQQFMREQSRTIADGVVAGAVES